MTERRRASAALAIVVVAVVGLALLSFAPTAIADSHGNGSGAYTISQEQCNPVTPVVNESQSVEEFYDYRSNETEQTGEFSSYGTIEYQEDNASTLLIYEGAEGTSLVILHEKFHENPEEGTNGSSVTFTVTGITPGDSWIVEDDDYTNHDDEFEHDDDSSEMTWVWAQGRNDGGAYRGLSGDDFEIGIEPQFNEDAEFRYNNQYAGMVHDWDVVTTNESGFERVALNNLEDQVTIEPGYCTPPDAEIATSNATPTIGQTVSLNASGSFSAADVTQYQWDLTGDGNTDETTTDPVLPHEFESADGRDVTVTVDDGYDSDEASVSVEVFDETPPSARIDAPDEVAATESLAFSANDSEDNGEIASYEWNFGDGGAGSGENVTHTYAEPGEYEVQLTVTDHSGNVDSTNETISVTEAPDPVAEIDANTTTADVGESIAFNAGGSAGDVVDYEWIVGDETISSNETAVHAFEDPGNYTVRLNVTDSLGNDNTTTETVRIEEPNSPAGPTAAVEAPADAAVNESVTLDASDSEVGGDPGYEWIVNGTVVATTTDPTYDHTFPSNGSYTVRVNVSDEYGSDTADATVEVSASSDPTDPEPPTARLDVPENGTVNESITLDANESTGNVASYEWEFGDGTTATGETVTHVYEEPGDYTIELTVVDENGANATTTETVTIATDDGEGGDNGEDGGSDESDSGDAGSGSSGSGGYAPAPQPDPVETSVERANGTIIVTAENARAGESVSVDVPAGTSVEDSVGSGAVELRSLAIVPSHNADVMTVRLEPADPAVPGRFSKPAAYVPNSTTELADVTYEFAIDPNATATAGVSAENLTAYAGGKEWDAVETAVDAGTNGETTITASATLDGGSPVGLGSEGAALLVTDVETVGVAADGTIDIAATALNTGNESGEWPIPITAGGETVQETVALEPGEETVVEASVAVDAVTDAAGETSTASVTVAGARRDMAMVSVTALEYSSTEPASNESVTISATLHNRGSAAGEFDAELVVDGEVATTETVAIGPGERTTLAFDHRFDAAGTYDLAIGNATASVDVEARDSFDGEGAENQSGATSGFGALAALLAAALVILGALVGSGRLGKRP